MALTTLENVKEFLQLTTTGLDALIENLIIRGDSQIKKFTDRELEESTLTQQYDGTVENGGVLNLDEFPVTSITTVHDDISLVFDASTLIPDTDYVFEAKPGILRLTPLASTLRPFRDPRQFNEGVQNIKVVYVAGFATIPGDLEQAAIELVAFRIVMADTNGGMIKSKRLADFQISYAGVGKVAMFPENVSFVLDGYKNRQLVVF